MIIPVILCGGAGTRLWPVSRRDAPKPFLPLVDGTSTFALTLARIADPDLFGPAIVVARDGHRHLVDDALAVAGATATVILEPEPRDTGPAIAAAATFVLGADAEATILVLPADHVVRDIAAFGVAVASAVPAADAGYIVTFGVRPDSPAAGYGYIRPGDAIEGTAASIVEGFVEKPDAERASELVGSGALWNSGMFLARAATFTSEFARHAPTIAATAGAAVAGMDAEGGALRLPAETFAAATKQSVDYAIMEKTQRAAVVEAVFDWSDLGAWPAVWEAASKDADGNAVEGDVVLVDTRGSYVATERQQVGVAGVDDMVVVVAADSVLVTSRARADTVKDLVGKIEAAPEKVIGDYTRHLRPWGSYQTVDLGAGHQVKRIVVQPGGKLSLQKHEHRAEHWTVVAGTAEVTIEGDTRRLEADQSAYIPRGAVHRLANVGRTPVTVIEVQVGEYLGEDDIVRLEDDYGRDG